MGHFDTVGQADIAALLQCGQKLSRVPVTEPTVAPPVRVGGVTAQVRYRRQDVVRLPTVRGQARVGPARIAHQQRRIPHQSALVDDIAEGTPPRSSEVEVVMGDLRVGLLRTQVQDHTGR